MTRPVGRRELSTLEPFDLILLVVRGDLIQQEVTQNDFSVTGAMLAGGTMAVMTALFSRRVPLPAAARADPEGRSRRARRAGEDDRPELAPNRITLEELAAQARLNAQIAHIDDVEWAVLETSGQISFIPKSGS